MCPRHVSSVTELTQPWPAMGTQKHKWSIMSLVCCVTTSDILSSAQMLKAKKMQVLFSMQTRFSCLHRMICFTVLWSSENTVVPTKVTYFNGTDRAGLSFMSNATNPSLLWHFLKFILIRMETKDKFPSALLKQLSSTLLFEVPRRQVCDVRSKWLGSASGRLPKGACILQSDLFLAI